MSSRMDRYSEEPINIGSRTKRNEELYGNIDKTEISRVKTNSNIKVIESDGKTIDIEKIKNYVLNMNEDSREPKKRVSPLIEEETSTESEKTLENTRVYDIISVLEKAKQNRPKDYEIERHKKLRDTQYDILSKIEMYDKKEDEELESDFNTDERTLIDLINTVTIHKDATNMLEDLAKPEENDEVIPPIKEVTKETIKKEIIEELKEQKKQEEIEKTQELVNLQEKDLKSNIDKSFYTNSMSFSKEDFEGLDELEKTVKKNNKLVIISVIMLVVAIIVSIILILNYVLDLGLF